MMYQFIDMLRAVACLLITNSHGEEVYPIRILASGGLLGDVIYFAISGFCLYSLSQSGFVKWYLRRLRRVYPPVWLTAGLFIVTKIYGNIPLSRVLELMIYPTHYHFVKSILLMYVVFYFMMRFVNSRPGQEDRSIRTLSIGLAVIFFAAFYTVFDSSYYHIDNVNSPMIWPLYLFSMLVGMYFRIHVKDYLGKGGIKPWIATGFMGVVYIATKLMASRGILPAPVQWINQLSLLVLLVCIFRSFIGFEQVVAKLPAPVKAPYLVISAMAFELYLAQAVIIPTFNTGKDTFPYNFLIVMSITFLCAWAVHHVTNIILYAADSFGARLAVKKGAKT